MMSIRYKEAQIKGTSLESVMSYLYDRLKNLHGFSRDIHGDKGSEKKTGNLNPIEKSVVIQKHRIEQPVFIRPNKIVVPYNAFTKGKKSRNKIVTNDQVYPGTAMSFDGIQHKIDPMEVRIKGECGDLTFLPEFENYWADMLKAYESPEVVLHTRQQQRKNGRPHFPEDVWGHDQVNTYGRPKGEVKVEWLKKVRENPAREATLDTSLEKQFERIIKSSWGSKGIK